MSKSPYKTVPVLSINVPEDRARNLDQDWVEALAAMFLDHGNKTAIEVRADGEGYVLVSGLHRLHAALSLKWEELTVKLVEASTDNEAAEYKLHEVIENIGRRELTILDRAHHLFEFDRVMKELHPELKNGGNTSIVATEANRTAIFAIRSDIAETVGLSDRSIRMAVQLWKALSKPTREKVDGTWLANHQAGLMGIAAHGAKMQTKILDVLFDENSNPKSVADALEFIENGRLVTSAERKIGGLIKSFSKLDDTGFDRILSLNKDRVQAWFDRQAKA
ncbi:MAG: chromosome partitioning protein ParB [Blastopirellula sp.]|nr:MAG: chromosome partitioning protein ParB [Blastopirellula sp.]